MEEVVLVDDQDRRIGSMEKLEAHRQGALHRAFSVYVVKDGKLLLQRRSASKYHSPGKWGNTCCSHPRIDEDILKAAHRRMREELGADCPLEEVDAFIYKADVGQRLTEHEFLHILVGKERLVPKPDPSEVMDTAWEPVDDILIDMKKRPERYCAWFRIVLPKIVHHLK